MSIKHELKKLELKLYKFLNKSNTLPLSKEERCALIIVGKLLLNKGNELLMYPSLNRFYIKSDDNGIFVVVTSNPNEITIINHVYCYNVKLGERSYNRIYDMFMEEVKRRRLAMEKEYTDNIQYSLMNVASKLTKIQQEKEQL